MVRGMSAAAARRPAIGLIPASSSGAATDAPTSGQTPRGKKKIDGSINKVDHFMSPEEVPKHVGKMSAAGRFHAQVPRPFQEREEKKSLHSGVKTYHTTSSAAKGELVQKQDPPYVPGPLAVPHSGRRLRPSPKRPVPSVFDENRTERESAERGGRKSQIREASRGITPGMEVSSARDDVPKAAVAPSASPRTLNLVPTISGAKPRAPHPYRPLTHQVSDRLKFQQPAASSTSGEDSTSIGVAKHGPASQRGYLAGTASSEIKKKISPTFKSNVGALLGNSTSEQPTLIVHRGRRTSVDAFVPEDHPRVVASRQRAASAQNTDSHNNGSNSTNAGRRPSLRHSVQVPLPSQIFKSDSSEPPVPGASTWDYNCIGYMQTHPEYAAQPSNRQVPPSRSQSTGRVPELRVGGEAPTAGRRSATPQPQSRRRMNESPQPRSAAASDGGDAYSASRGKRLFARQGSGSGMLSWE